MEKNLMRSMELVGRERMEVAVSHCMMQNITSLLTLEATTLDLG
jgi:hypothetical protein